MSVKCACVHCTLNITPVRLDIIEIEKNKYVWCAGRMRSIFTDGADRHIFTTANGWDDRRRRRRDASSRTGKIKEKNKSKHSAFCLLPKLPKLPSSVDRWRSNMLREQVHAILCGIASQSSFIRPIIHLVHACISFNPYIFLAVYCKFFAIFLCFFLRLLALPLTFLFHFLVCFTQNHNRTHAYWKCHFAWALYAYDVRVWAYGFNFFFFFLHFFLSNPFTTFISIYFSLSLCVCAQNPRTKENYSQSRESIYLIFF